MTGQPEPAHGCTINGEPAMPILIADYNQLTARTREAEARLSHLQASSEAAGRLLARTTDERAQLQAAIARVATLVEERDSQGRSSGHPLTVTRLRDALADTGPTDAEATQEPAL